MAIFRDLRERTGSTSAIALVCALGYSLLIVGFGFLFPAGSYSSTSSDGTTESGTTTLVQQNGWWGGVVVAIPMVFAFAIAALLWNAEQRPARTGAWIVWAILALGNIAALMSIGIVVAPMTFGLLVACGTFESRAQRAYVPPAAPA